MWLNFSYCTLMNFNHKNIKDITTSKKGTKDSWNALRKATSISRRDKLCKFNNIAHEGTFEEWIYNRVVKLACLGLMNHEHDFIYSPWYAIISNYSYFQ